MTQDLRSAFLPVYQNPYQHLLTNALKSKGVDVIHLTSMPSINWLVENRDHVNILHFHWLSGLYMAKFLTPIRILEFIFRLYIANYLNYHIVWTAHNILPHNKPIKPIHNMIRRFFLMKTDAVISHCTYGKEALIHQFQPSAPIYIIPHGNYLGVHNITMTRESARSSLDIKRDQFVYLMVGNITAYKGIDKFINAFQKVSSNYDIAIIAGRNRAPKLVEKLITIANKDPRIRIYPGFISEGEMQRYLLSADTAVFAFDEILTSGSVILCLTYGLPVVVPAIGCLPELITPEVGILYSQSDPSSLENALTDIRKANISSMSIAAKRISQTLKWDDIALKTKTVYLGCINN